MWNNKKQQNSYSLYVKLTNLQWRPTVGLKIIVTSVTSDFKIPDAFIQHLFNVSGYPIQLETCTGYSHETHDRYTRLANSYDAHVPSHSSEILKRRFAYNGSVLWNSIRHEVKLVDNVNAFNRMYKDMILFPSQLCN